MKSRKTGKAAKASTVNEYFSEWYDSEDDIYYVNMHTGEPSIVNEIEDDLLVEVGLFTGLPTGLRVLNFTRSGKEVFPDRALEAVGTLLSLAKSKFDSLHGQRETRFEERLEKVFA